MRSRPTTCHLYLLIAFKPSLTLLYIAPAFVTTLRATYIACSSIVNWRCFWIELKILFLILFRCLRDIDDLFLSFSRFIQMNILLIQMCAMRIWCLIDQFTPVPLTIELCLFLTIYFYSYSMIHILLPTALMLLLVWISHYTIPMLLTIPESPRKNFAVTICFCAESVHCSFLEFTNISFLKTCEIILSLAIELSFKKVTYVVTTIIPIVLSMSILFSFSKMSDEPWIIG